MRRVFTKLPFLVFLLFVFFSIFLIPDATAATVLGVPQQPTLNTTTQEAYDYIKGDITADESAAGQLNVITENTEYVAVTFKGLAKKKYKICLNTSCDKDEEKPKEVEIVEKDEIIDGDEANGYTLTKHFCPAGDNIVKYANEVGTTGHGCRKEDYFHGRKIYTISIADDEDDIVVDEAKFFVSMYYPEVWLDNDKPTPGQNIIVNIRGTRRNHLDGNRNNYAIELAKLSEPGKIYTDNCFKLEESEKEKGQEIDMGKREEGDWLIKLNEQAHEGGWTSGRSGCSAEFTYYWIVVRVRSQEFWNKQARGEAEGIENDVKGVELIVDPNGSDLKGAKKAILPPPPPCAEEDEENGGCSKVKTGLGITISTAPGEFIGDIYGIILGLSGGVALVFIIYSGFQLITSQGKPEKLEAAREQLVSAIIGLVFIVLALTITQIIGVDILQLPGFSR